MNKRGQVYLLAAIMLCFIIYLLVVERNIGLEKVIEDDFKELSTNYEVESNKFVNALLLENKKEIADSFVNFSILYSSYARAQNPNFGLIYAFYNNNILYMGNYMDQSIMVKYGLNEIGLNGCYDNISAVIKFMGFSIDSGLKNNIIKELCIANVTAPGLSEISLILNGGYYTFGISANKPEIIIVSRESLEGISKVYVGGEFKIPKSGDSEKELCSKQINKENCEKLKCKWEGNRCIIYCYYYKDMNTCNSNGDCCWKGSSYYEGVCKNKGNCKDKL
jgi:hypothetical protein